MTTRQFSVSDNVGCVIVAVALLVALAACVIALHISDEHRVNHFQPGRCGEVVTGRTHGQFTSKRECAK